MPVRVAGGGGGSWSWVVSHGAEGEDGSSGPVLLGRRGAGAAATRDKAEQTPLLSLRARQVEGLEVELREPLW